MKPYNLPPEYYRSLGVLTSEFSGLERLTTTCIRYCSSIGTWDEAVCLIGGDEYGALLKKLEKLINTNLKDESDLLAQFNPTLRLLTAVNDDRNKYIHSLWTLPSIMDSLTLSDLSPVRRKFLRNFNLSKGLEDVEPVPLAMLDKCITDISDAKCKLRDFFIGNLEKILAAIDRRKNEEANRFNVMPDNPN